MALLAVFSLQRIIIMTPDAAETPDKENLGFKKMPPLHYVLHVFFRSNSISVLGNLRSSLLLSFPLLPTVNECPFSLIKQRLSGGRRFGRFSPISIRGNQAGGNPLSSPPRLYYGGRRVRRTPQENRGLDVGGNCSKFFRATQREGDTFRQYFHLGNVV